MNPEAKSEGSLLTELRAGFDRNFAVRPSARELREPLLHIRVGGERYAVRTGNIGGLARIRKIVPMPSRISEMLGLTALRGVIVPVFDLAALLAIPSDAGAPEWLILTAGDTPLGFAFHEFEGQQMHEPLDAEASPDPREGSRQFVRAGLAIRSVLDIARLSKSVRVRAGDSEGGKEKRQ